MTVLFGTYSSPNASLDAFEAADETYGRRMTLARTYWNLDASIPAISQLAADGRIPIVSFGAKHWRYPEMTMTGIATGRYDAVLEGLAAGLGTIDAPMYLTFQHEPDLPGARFTQGAWASAYRRFYDVVHPAVGAAVRIGPVFTGYYWRDQYGSLKLGQRVQFVGIDPYCWPSAWQSTADVITNAVRPVRERWPRRPVVVCETGCDEDPRKPQWIAELPAAVRANPAVVGVAWFDVTKEHDWRMRSSAASTAAARAMLTDPVWRTA